MHDGGDSLEEILRVRACWPGKGFDEELCRYYICKYCVISMRESCGGKSLKEGILGGGDCWDVVGSGGKGLTMREFGC